MRTREQLAERVCDIVGFHFTNNPISAYELGYKLGYSGSRESVRRNARHAVAITRELIPNSVGADERGYFCLRLAADRHAWQEFIRTHGKKELYTARVRRVNPNQQEAV